MRMSSQGGSSVFSLSLSRAQVFESVHGAARVRIFARATHREAGKHGMNHFKVAVEVQNIGEVRRFFFCFLRWGFKILER